MSSASSPSSRATDSFVLSEMVLSARPRRSRSRRRSAPSVVVSVISSVKSRLAQGCSAEYAPTVFGTQADHCMTLTFLNKYTRLDSGLGTRDSGLGTRDSGLGARSSGLGTRGSGLGTRDQGSGIRDQRFRDGASDWRLGRPGRRSEQT